MFQFFSTSPIQIEGMGSARMEETSPHTFARQARKAKLQDTRETERVIMGRRMKYFFKVVNKLTPVLLDINLRPKTGLSSEEEIHGSRTMWLLSMLGKTFNSRPFNSLHFPLKRWASFKKFEGYTHQSGLELLECEAEHNECFPGTRQVCKLRVPNQSRQGDQFGLMNKK